MILPQSRLICKQYICLRSLGIFPGNHLYLMSPLRPFISNNRDFYLCLVISHLESRLEAIPNSVNDRVHYRNRAWTGGIHDIIQVSFQFL